MMKVVVQKKSYSKNNATTGYFCAERRLLPAQKKAEITD
jgi:hypothetical protein